METDDRGLPYFLDLEADESAVQDWLESQFESAGYTAIQAVRQTMKSNAL